MEVWFWINWSIQFFKLWKIENSQDQQYIRNLRLAQNFGLGNILFSSQKIKFLVISTKFSTKQAFQHSMKANKLVTYMDQFRFLVWWLIYVLYFNQQNSCFACHLLVKIILLGILTDCSSELLNFTIHYFGNIYHIIHLKSNIRKYY